MRIKPKAINSKKIVKKYFGNSTEQGLVSSVISKFRKNKYKLR
jgi:hypothetical protein